MSKLKSIYHKYRDELGILTSYSALIITSYFVEWKAYGILMSYLFETFILFIFYIIVRTKGEFSNPNSFKNHQSYGNLIYGVIPFFLIQYFMLAVGAMIIDDAPDLKYLSPINLISIESLIAFGSLAVFYIKKLKEFNSTIEQYKNFRNNFLFKVIVVTATSVIGLIILSIFDGLSLFTILCCTVPVRVGFELYFRKKFVIMRH